MEKSSLVDKLKTLRMRCDRARDGDGIAMLDEVIAQAETLDMKTCEKCDSWKIDDVSDFCPSDSRECGNVLVGGLVSADSQSSVYFDKDFGCLFWSKREK
jgi:hypothetical protein